MGDGLDEGVEIGPIISNQACQNIDDLVQASVKMGAKLELGGARHAAGENDYQPTVLLDVKNDMPVATNEIFGPVSSVIPFTD